jgi:hypothetical protein
MDDINPKSWFRMMDQFQSFLEPLQAVQKLLQNCDNQGVVIGGIASSLIGKARFTADVDVMILLKNDDIQKVLDYCESIGLTSRTANALEFAQKNRMILLHQVGSEINIDISMGILPFEYEVVDRKIEKCIGNLSILLPTPEDLIIMKAVAHRAKDMEDIIGIIESSTKLDTQRIKHWLQQFSQVLDKPEIWLDVEKILSTN